MWDSRKWWLLEANKIQQHVDQELGDYQNGFRKDRSTTGKMRTIRQNLEKCYKYNTDVNQLNVDFLKDYESSKRDYLEKAMYKVGVQVWLTLVK